MICTDIRDEIVVEEESKATEAWELGKGVWNLVALQVLFFLILSKHVLRKLSLIF